mmetsp:Transcript_6642/g.16261  ORF Transcript_6642/g.16261 Transcript_6642/m.16261 type:complete len:146 (+) Transcript_6642:69-506(+)
MALGPTIQKFANRACSRNSKQGGLAAQTGSHSRTFYHKPAGSFSGCALTTDDDGVALGLVVRDGDELELVRFLASRQRNGVVVILDRFKAAATFDKELIHVEPPGHEDTLCHLKRLQTFMCDLALDPTSLVDRVDEKRRRYLISL